MFLEYLSYIHQRIPSENSAGASPGNVLKTLLCKSRYNSLFVLWQRSQCNSNRLYSNNRVYVIFFSQIFTISIPKNYEANCKYKKNKKTESLKSSTHTSLATHQFLAGFTLETTSADLPTILSDVAKSFLTIFFRNFDH